MSFLLIVFIAYGSDLVPLGFLFPCVLSSVSPVDVSLGVMSHLSWSSRLLLTPVFTHLHLGSLLDSHHLPASDLDTPEPLCA